MRLHRNYQIPPIDVGTQVGAARAGSSMPRQSTRSSHVKTLRVRGLRPQLLGSFHGHCALRACPPSIIGFVVCPHHQCGDLRWIAGRVQGLAAHKAWCLTLCETVAVEELLGLVDSFRFGPMMRQYSDHKFLTSRSENIDALPMKRETA